MLEGTLIEKRSTPDKRYFVVRGRLWRLSDPTLDEATRKQLVLALMAARRDVAKAKRACDVGAEEVAHAHVDRAKRALGERGPVWWTDGSPDYNRHLVANTPYAAWYERSNGECDENRSEREKDRSAD